METVSVIIPAFNRTELLRECVSSVAAQSYPSIELIVVDDASAVSLVEVVDSFRPKFPLPIKFVRMAANCGPGAAREAGRQVACGAYLSYLDSDDVWHPRKIARQVETLKRDSSAGMCYCASRLFTALPIAGPPVIRTGSDVPVRKFLPQVLESRPWGTAACLWTRASTDRIGAWWTGRDNEDYEYDCRAGCLDIEIAFIPEVLCYYRQGQGTKLDDADAPLHRAIAALEMSRHLRDAGKTEDAGIRGRIVWRLFDRGVELLKINESRDAAIQCLAAALGSSDVDAGITRAIGSVLDLTRQGQWRQAAQLGVEQLESFRSWPIH